MYNKDTNMKGGIFYMKKYMIFIVIATILLLTACNAEIAKLETTINLNADEISVTAENSTYDTLTSNTKSSEETNVITLKTKQNNVVVADVNIINDIAAKYSDDSKIMWTYTVFVDLNSDNVAEMFVMSIEQNVTGIQGWVEVYDVTKSAEAITKFCTTYLRNGGLYKDKSGKLHCIVRGGWWGQSDSYFKACYDVTEDGLTVPLCAIANWWYEDSGAFECNYAVYKGVSYDVENGYVYGDYGFRKDEENFLGYFAENEILDSNIESKDSDSFEELLNTYVYHDLVRVTNITEVNDDSDFSDENRDGLFIKACTYYGIMN